MLPSQYTSRTPKFSQPLCLRRGLPESHHLKHPYHLSVVPSNRHYGERFRPIIIIACTGIDVRHSVPLAGAYVPWFPVPRIDMSTLEPMSPRGRSVLDREVETLFGTVHRATDAVLVRYLQCMILCFTLINTIRERCISRDGGPCP
ncbi:hypothetical protein OG21DRAFT_111803 [Imleria badia]|nr:hypothetical protein OG21DRAFT_111803 [Imleria badia]